MFINGVSASADLLGIIKQLHQLPSCYSEEKQSLPLSLSEWDSEKAYEARRLSHSGALSFSERKYAKAISFLEESSTIHEQNEEFEQLLIDLGLLHTASVEVLKARWNQDLDEDALRLQNNLPHIRKKIRRERQRPSGLSIPEAVRVEQGEVGFSADVPFGTDGIAQCVCLVLRNPATMKTALCHIDCDVDVDSLAKIKDRLLEGSSPDQLLEAKVVGCKSLGGQVVDDAIQNINTIVGFLGPLNVNVISADLFSDYQPSALVVFPEDFRCADGTATAFNPNRDLSTAVINKHKIPLRVAFDLTYSDQRAAILLDGNMVSHLRENYFGKSISDVYSTAEGKCSWVRGIRESAYNIYYSEYLDNVFCLCDVTCSPQTEAK